MNVSLNELSPEITYKLLAGLVIPRPIAWISTRGENGIANCAPFSFFNLVSVHPPMCAIGINARTTRQGIVAPATIDGVIARTARQGVGAVAAG